MNIEKLIAIADEVWNPIGDLMIDKNHDYASDKDALRNMTMGAEIVKALRLDLTKRTHIALHEIVNKVHRLMNLESRDGVKNEPVIDSVRDGIVFFILYYAMWKEDKV